MIVINLQDKKEYDITVTRNGENTMTCPVCSDSRKKSKVKCFSFNYDKKAGRCGHCGVVLVEKRDFKPQTQYKRPEWNPKNEILSEKAVEWFKQRKISISTLLHFKITEGQEVMPQHGHTVNTIQFNYFRDGELLNIKYRDGLKNFKMVSGAELIFYNIDAIIGAKEVIIVEGEMDALAMHEAGFQNVISVPNGATQGRNNLTYLDNCIDSFLEETEFIIATDNDVAGSNLRDELVRRLGAENCYKVSFRDCKDANECLIKYGREGVKEAVLDKRPYPISGIFTASDINEEIDHYHKYGLPEGCGIGEPEFDKLLKFHEGYLTIITGIPGHGKSEWLDFLTSRLNILHKWKGGLYSPENYPLQLHFSKFAEKLIGKPFKKITEGELATVKKHFDENFYFIKPEDNSRLDSILDKVKYLVRKKGIRFFVIDAWNKIEHEYAGNENETQYISRILDKITIFGEKHMVHIFLVAHPTKMKKGPNGLFEVPNLYSISGSANFFSKPANGISVYRNFETGRSEVYVQKVKFKHFGEVGMVEFEWDYQTGRYYRLQADYSNWLSKDGKQLNMNQFIESKKQEIPTGEDEIPF